MLVADRATAEAPAPPRRAAPPTLARHAVAGLLVLAVVVGFFVFDYERLTRPFGNSHDGWNGSMWGVGSAAIRDDGPIESALGARTVNGTYAHHPPLILVTTAVAEVVLGERPAAVRAGVVASSVASILLVYLALVSARVRPIAAAAGVVFGFATPFFFVYGGVQDTPMFSLALGCAVFLLWQRSRTGAREPSWLLGVAAALACLAGWQAATFVGLLTIAALTVDRKTTPKAAALALAIGGAAGVVLTAGWAFWAYEGTVRPLFNAANYRSGDGSITLKAAFETQRNFLRPLVPHLTLLAGVALAGLATAPRRLLGGVVAAIAVVAYAIAMKEATLHHQYWMFWLVVPLAIGIAGAADAALRLVQRWPPLEVAAALGLVVLSASTLVQAVRSDVFDERANRDSAAAAVVYAGEDWPDGQEYAWLWGPAPLWPAISYYSGLPTRHLSEEGFRNVVATRPADLVFDTTGPLVLERADALAARRLPPPPGS